MSQAVRLVNQGLSSDVAEKLAEFIQVPLAQDVSSEGSDVYDLILLAEGHDSPKVNHPHAVIGVGGDYVSYLSGQADARLELTLQLRAFYMFEITQSIVFFVTHVMRASDEHSSDIATAIHEAVMNAMVHGNMGIHSKYADLTGMEDFYQMVESQFSQDSYLEKDVHITMAYSPEYVVVSISDQGKGYEPGHVKSAGEASHELHGRGLQIIKETTSSFSVSEDGRTIHLSFARYDEAAEEALEENVLSPEALGIKDSRILIIDDTEFNRFMIQEVMEDNGFHNIRQAKDGIEGVDITREWQPDLVFLDLMMPRMDGFEYCETMRAEERFSDMPIIVQTALSSADQRARAFKVGATDLVTKPINPDELISRTTIHIERAALLKSLLSYRQRLEAELESAREMQNAMMPNEEQIAEVKNNIGLDIASHFETSSEIGGDFWGFKILSDHEVAVYSADFSGHGVTSALNTFRMHTIMQKQRHFADPAMFLTELNDNLVGLLSTGQFATMFYGVINMKQEMLYYATAAAPSPIHYEAEHKEMHVVNGAGFPLGIVKGHEYDLQRLSFRKGDILLLYSDALIETPNDNDVFLDEEQLCDQVRHHTDSADDVLQSILMLFQPCKKHVKDDLTIGVFARPWW